MGYMGLRVKINRPTNRQTGETRIPAGAVASRRGARSRNSFCPEVMNRAPSTAADMRTGDAKCWLLVLCVCFHRTQGPVRARQALYASPASSIFISFSGAWDRSQPCFWSEVVCHGNHALTFLVHAFLVWGQRGAVVQVRVCPSQRWRLENNFRCDPQVPSTFYLRWSLWV